ncbi:hypothetical protein [Dialister succinatiphilus]|uniref:hypothetical protein n=1 Tax=Dialister succinatiphilus TaxID=487173 RepID=UPI004027913E
MARIYAPNKEYNGLTATVRFVGGVGESTDPYLLKWFTEHGYTVKIEEAPKEEAPKTAKKGK